MNDTESLAKLDRFDRDMYAIRTQQENALPHYRREDVGSMIVIRRDVNASAIKEE